MTKVEDAMPSVRATGSCLCGAVRYEVTGPLRDVVECHCAMCRKTHGHIGAYTATPKVALRIVEARGLVMVPIVGARAARILRRVRRERVLRSGAEGLHGDRRGHARFADGLEDHRADPRASAADYYRIDETIPQRLD